MTEMTTERIVECLNTAYKSDPDAIHALMCVRIPCNTKLVVHPDVVVGKNSATGGWIVGPLGVINGCLTSIGLKRVAMKWSDTKREDGTFEFLGFCVAENDIVG